MSITRLYDDTVAFAPNWNINYYYACPGQAANVAALAIGSFRSNPLYVPRNLTIDRIGVEVTIATDTDACARLGIYEDNGSHSPSVLLKDLGLTSAFTAAGYFEITISQQLGPGLYWLSACMQRITQTATAYSGGNPTMRTQGNRNIQLTTGTSTANTSQLGTSVQHTSATSGSLPGTASLNGLNGFGSRVWVRCAS